jgi:hypothetical protein
MKHVFLDESIEFGKTMIQRPLRFGEFFSRSLTAPFMGAEARAKQKQSRLDLKEITRRLVKNQVEQVK